MKRLVHPSCEITNGNQSSITGIMKTVERHLKPQTHSVEFANFAPRLATPTTSLIHGIFNICTVYDFISY
jgi:hypothetical protein